MPIRFQYPNADHEKLWLWVGMLPVCIFLSFIRVYVGTFVCFKKHITTYTEQIVSDFAQSIQLFKYSLRNLQERI